MNAWVLQVGPGSAHAEQSVGVLVGQYPFSAGLLPCVDAQAKISAIDVKLKGRTPPKDQAGLSRQCFMRDELKKMTGEQRASIIADAIKQGDDFLVSAIFDGRPFETGTG